MSTLRRTRNTPLALALAGAMLVTAPLLGGCSIINQFLPGGGGGIGGVIPGTGVPSDFPSEVPLIDGEVLLGLSVPGDDGEKAWNVTIKVSGADAFDTIKDQLTGAGFEYQELGTTGDGASGGFTKEPYAVIVVVAQADGDWTANYTVTNAATNN
ncbi:MAG: hypothetical protein R2717_04195 [Schumannella sp.]|nr:hypothetical protein [Microbacteriaceae bacterium]